MIHNLIHNLIFHTFSYTLRRILFTVKVISWESKGLSSESTMTPDNNLSATIKNSMEIEIFFLVYKDSCLKQDRALLPLEI